MWYFVTLSTPNSSTEPHGKVTASATPFSSTSRTSGALRLHVGAAELRHPGRDGALRRAGSSCP